MLVPYHLFISFEWLLQVGWCQRGIREVGLCGLSNQEEIDEADPLVILQQNGNMFHFLHQFRTIQ